jgi:hypothetical protein
VVLEAPWPPVESYKIREGWPHRFEGLPDVHYGDAEHLVDELADAGISNGLTAWLPISYAQPLKSRGKFAALDL